MKITGTVPANNYVVLPRPQAEMKALALKGRYIYIGISGIDEAPYALHLDYTFSDRKNVRLSLSNMYKEEKFDQLSLHIPLSLQEKIWYIVCLDAKGIFAKYNCIRDIKESISLKAVTICANLKISKITTSDKLYDTKELPRELNFKNAEKDKWGNIYQWVEPLRCDHVAYKPENPKEEEKKELKKEKKRTKKVQSKDKTAQEQLEEEAKYTKIRAKSEETKARLLQKIIGKENLNKNDEEHLRSPHNKMVKMPKDTLLNLKTVIGSTVGKCTEVCWSKNSEKKEIIYASGSMIVITEIDSERQRFLKGHTKPIETICISPKGDIIGSAEIDTIKVWNFVQGKCIGSWVVDGHSNLRCIGICNESKNLVSVGKDQHNRDVITVWNLHTLEQINSYQPQPEIVARHVSLYDIVCIKFSPQILYNEQIEPELQLCSCGKENIRFWQVKPKCMRGTAVVLDKYSRNTLYTCLDYEGKEKVYIGSKEGMILQVNAETQQLEFVYQLHDQGIRSIAACSAYCATGSDDLFIRVWPLDFSEFFMEAKHDSTIQAVSISPDRVEILCGTENSCVGILDIPNQKYKTLIRSHTQPILAADARKNLLFTLSQDKTIRVWDARNAQQLYEFASNEDQALSVAIHPTKDIFCCGFASGTLRLFDIEATAVTEEYQTLEKPLITLKYLEHSNILIAMSDDGSLSFFNSNTHQPIKQVTLGIPTPYHGLTVLKSEKAFATIGSNATAISIWDTASLSSPLSIPIVGGQARDIAFRSPLLQLFVVTTDAQLRVFSIDGKPITKFLCIFSFVIYFFSIWDGFESLGGVMSDSFPHKTEIT